MPPPPPTWDPYQSSKRVTRKCKIIVRNKVFEFQEGGGTLIFSSYVGSGPAFTIHPYKGSAVFSEHWADPDLHCNCCAPPLPPHGNLTKVPRGRQENAIKVFESQGWGGGTLIFFFIRRLGPSIYHSPQNKYQKFQAPQKYSKF